MTEFLSQCFSFLTDNVYYFLTFYIIVSFYGYTVMKRYVHECLINKVVPFNNNIIKMATVSVICGLFTTLVIIIGILMSIAEFFRKKN